MSCRKSQCPCSYEFTIEELCDLIFPPDMGVTGHLCMIYHCFLDDSKDQNQKRLMVSAGFVATKEQWGELRIAWAKELHKSGIEYFKSSEYNHLDGEFSRFRTNAYPRPKGRDAAREIRERFIAILKDRPHVRGIGISIPLEDYARAYSRPEAKGVLPENPYEAALVSVMYETACIVKKRPGKNMVAFVHDEGSDFEQLRQAYKNFKIINPRIAKFMGGFTPLDDKKHPPLQLADMIANHALELGLEAQATNTLKVTPKEMGQNINLLGVWTEEYILSVLKRNLIRKGRPIPVDLDNDQYG